MPRRFFRKFALKRDKIRTRWYLSPFAHLLHDPNLWGVRRRSVVPAFALGVFISFMPFPGHMLIATLLALLLRVNIPVAAVSTWIVNPFLMYPMFRLAYDFGRSLLDMQPHPFDFELSFSWLVDGFVYIWEPLLLGCVLFGSAASLVGFVALDMLWRASISDYLKKRRARKKQRALAED